MIPKYNTQYSKDYIGDTKRGIFASFSFGKQNRTGRKLLSQITGSSKFRIENEYHKVPGFSDRLREMETNGTVYNLLTMNCEKVSNYLRSNSQLSFQVTVHFWYKSLILGMPCFTLCLRILKPYLSMRSISNLTRYTNHFLNITNRKWRTIVLKDIVRILKKLRCKKLSDYPEDARVATVGVKSMKFFNGWKGPDDEVTKEYLDLVRELMVANIEVENLEKSSIWRQPSESVMIEVTEETCINPYNGSDRGVTMEVTEE